MKKSLIFLLLIVFCLLALVGCKGEKKPVTDPDTSKGERPGLGKRKEDEDLHIYGDGLVKLDLEGGVAYLSFDHEKWDEKYDIYDDYPLEGFSKDQLSWEPFPIRTLSGCVEEAYIIGLSTTDDSMFDFTLPTVVLIMENETIEYLYANPFDTWVTGPLEGYEEERKFESSRIISNTGKITSFSYEKGQKDIPAAHIMDEYGGNTLYLFSEDGKKYDFYYLWLETKLISNPLIAQLNEANEDYISINAYIYIDPGGGFRLSLGEWYSYYPIPLDYFEAWTGYLYFVTEEDGDYPPGTIIYDLSLIWSIYEDYPSLPREISGVYRLERDFADTLCLYHMEGDDLYQGDRSLKELILWGAGYNSDYDMENESLGSIELQSITERGAHFKIQEMEFVEDPEEDMGYRYEKISPYLEDFYANWDTGFTIFSVEEGEWSPRPKDVGLVDFIEEFLEPRPFEPLVRFRSVGNVLTWVKEEFIP